MESAKSRSWQLRLHEIIYESHTTTGKIFDITLLCMIVLSILVVILDSTASLHQRYGDFFNFLEWAFTILFTIEYILRLICIKKPLGYVFSFFGIIDLLSIIPGYATLLLSGSQSLLVFRALRLLRVFRVFKLAHFISEMQFLKAAITASLKKISIFMFTVVTIVIIMGSVMYLVEGGQNGFSSIPDSIYWAIVTITTVGYGDISPVTALGKFIASIIMLMGYGIIAVPTGIITTQMALAVMKKEQNQEACPGCGREGHDANAVYCKFCGVKL